MKVSRQQAQENRARVLRLAMLRFRERGFQGVSVAELMREAGLTHGGFYKQFASKEDLIAQACAAAIADNLACYRVRAEAAAREGGPASALEAVLTGVFTEEHRLDFAQGCTLAALGSEIARADAKTREEITRGIREIIVFLEELLTDAGTPPKQARQRALSTYATIVGALLISRAVDDTALAADFLKAALEQARAPRP